MDALHVHRLDARYRLVPSAAAAGARLDRVLDGLLADALAAAATAAGLEERDELCVRRVDAAVRVPASAPDGDVARVWATALVEAVARALRGGGVVRYRSRRHALLDVAISVARGDTTRAWAWRQLGLWDARPAAGDRDAIERLVAALLAQPEAIAAVLPALARDGDALVALAPRLEPSHWHALAAAALAAAGAQAERLFGGVSVDPRSSSRVAAAPAAAGMEVASRSVISRVLLRDASATLADPVTRRAVAAVALLELEPAATRDVARGAALLDGIAATLARLAADAPPRGAAARDAAHEPAQRTTYDGRSAPGDDRGVRDPDSSPTAGAMGPATPEQTDSTPEEAAGAEPDAAVGSASAAATPAGPDRPRTVPPHDAGAAADSAAGRHATPAAAAAGDAVDRGGPADAQRAAAWTHAGGLLFLLNVLDELEFGDAIARDEVLEARPFRWSLHRLALQLAPVGAEDPAALAFAGLGPDADPPTLGEEPPTDAELERIVAFADAVVEQLRDRLDRPDDPPLTLLDLVCRRRAEIVADPGWIEARFSTEDADVELRRAALDLDPGWLPWLGAVVVFAYA